MSGPLHFLKGAGRDHQQAIDALAPVRLPEGPAVSGRPSTSTASKAEPEILDGIRITCHDGITTSDLRSLGLEFHRIDDGQGIVSFDQRKICGFPREVAFSPAQESLLAFARSGDVSLYIAGPQDGRRRADGTVDTSSLPARLLTIGKDHYIGALHVPGELIEEPYRLRLNPEITFLAASGTPPLYRTLAELRRRETSIDPECGMLRFHGEKDVRLELRGEPERTAKVSISQIPFTEEVSRVVVSLAPRTAKAGAHLRECDVVLQLVDYDGSVRPVVIDDAGGVVIKRRAQRPADG